MRWTHYAQVDECELHEKMLQILHGHEAQKLEAPRLAGGGARLGFIIALVGMPLISFGMWFASYATGLIAD